MTTPPDKELKQLIDNLVTECTRCKCEIRLRDVSYKEKEKGPILCPRCRRLTKPPDRITK